MTTNSKESALLDIRITQTVIDFAQALLDRYNLEYARCNREGRQLDIDFGIDHNKEEQEEYLDDPYYAEKMYSNDGESNGILKCIEIFHELVDGEVNDRERYTLESKK
jgi:hypothetical protein